LFQKEQRMQYYKNSKRSTGKAENDEKRKKLEKHSVAGTRIRVSRVRAEYPNQLDYNGVVVTRKHTMSLYFIKSVSR
jgi:hypothetical protein